MMEKFKLLCINFFTYWWNQPGANTEEGYDEWVKQATVKALIDEMIASRLVSHKIFLVQFDVYGKSTLNLGAFMNFDEAKEFCSTTAKKRHPDFVFVTDADVPGDEYVLACRERDCAYTVSFLIIDSQKLEVHRGCQL